MKNAYTRHLQKCTGWTNLGSASRRELLSSAFSCSFERPNSDMRVVEKLKNVTTILAAHTAEPILQTK